jgi:DNA-binding transcriptional regulator YiaG
LGKFHLPNIGDDLDADVGQAMTLFTQPTSYSNSGTPMKANELLRALEKSLKTESQSDLADALGVTVTTLSNWKRQDAALAPSQIANAIAKSRKAAIKRSQLNTIWPIVELFPVQRYKPRGKSWQVFDAGKTSSRYCIGLKERLTESSGIYIFYDTRGRALYVGKAKDQMLWNEINLAFNRKRGVQKFMLIAHPTSNIEFKAADERSRQPKDTQLELCDVAAYFSAYDVDKGMIDDLEALLIRGFPNDLLNVKMETFARTRN